MVLSVCQELFFLFSAWSKGTGVWNTPGQKAQQAQMLQTPAFQHWLQPSPQMRSRGRLRPNYITGFDPRAEAEVRDLI